MNMKKLIAVLGSLLFASAFAGEPAKPAADAQSGTKVHRYLIERTFPAGALEGLDAATKAKVNSNNASVGVKWIQSYANADKTKTFCVYEGPSEAAVRKAAELNKLPVDSVMEVPVTLLPK
jgi:predicted amidohydrolase YtcJ